MPVMAAAALLVMAAARALAVSSSAPASAPIPRPYSDISDGGIPEMGAEQKLDKVFYRINSLQILLELEPGKTTRIITSRGEKFVRDSHT